MVRARALANSNTRDKAEISRNAAEARDKVKPEAEAT